MSAVIDGQDLEGCHLLFSDRGWEVINLFHPVSSNVKRIQEIVIIAEDAPLDYGINIITQDANLAHFTPDSFISCTVCMCPILREHQLSRPG